MWKTSGVFGASSESQGNNPITHNSQIYTRSKNHRNTPNPIQTLHYSSTLENTPQSKTLRFLVTIIFRISGFFDAPNIASDTTLHQKYEQLNILPPAFPLGNLWASIVSCSPQVSPPSCNDAGASGMPFQRDVFFFGGGGSKKTMVILFGVGRNKQQKRAARSQTLSWQLVKLLSHVPGSTQPGLD